VGPEVLGFALTAVVSAVTGGSWVANKLMTRNHERIVNLYKRLDHVENQVERLPLEYVLKTDFLREIQVMHDNFKQINNKLDKLMEKLFER
jgi:tetrahydromethanopterin S-methyltransferase subunit G